MSNKLLSDIRYVLNTMVAGDKIILYFFNERTLDSVAYISLNDTYIIIIYFFQ